MNTATVIEMKQQKSFVEQHNTGIIKTSAVATTGIVGGGITCGLWMGGSALLAMAGAWQVVGALFIVFAVIAGIRTVVGMVRIVTA